VVVAVDAPTPLATWSQFATGPFIDLAAGYDTGPAQIQLMVEATRRCESECDRRLAPFINLTETQRAEGVDVEDVSDGYVPLDPAAQLGVSRAQSLGASLLVRHCWVREFPARYPDMWTGSVSAIRLSLSFAGTSTVDVAGIQYEPDTGHIRFTVGTFLPPGSTIAITYGGGYSTMPADLVRAGRLMAASLAAQELDPLQNDGRHDVAALEEAACKALRRYMRDGGGK
jgi:hypothetical protein